MKITFCCTDTEPDLWLSGLQAALPDAEVSLWRTGAPLADHAVVWAPPQQFFDEQTQLKGVFNIAAGVDALLKLRLPPGALVVRLDDAGMSVQMAEYVCHAVIRYFREFEGYAEDAKNGKWARRNSSQRDKFEIGVMGLGVLGHRVAKSLRAFEFPVYGWSRSVKRLEGVKCFEGASQFSEFLSKSQVLVNLLPLTLETQDLLNRTTLSQLKPGAFVINVARGAHLVEDDLLALLNEGHLAGATLDVFRTEPLPATHPFWRHPKITVTPHTSARTLRETSVAQIVGKILTLSRGESINGVVDQMRGY